jgi:hypothetical protein
MEPQAVLSKFSSKLPQANKPVAFLLKNPFYGMDATRSLYILVGKGLMVIGEK